MVQKSTDILTAVRLITAQLFFLERKRIGPFTIFIISKKLFPVRLERRNRMIRSKKVNVGLPAHKSILQEGHKSLFFPDTPGLHRLRDPICIIKLFYSIKVCIFHNTDYI